MYVSHIHVWVCYMSSFNFWASFPLGVHSFKIYSFLLDPLDLETSRLDV